MSTPISPDCQKFAAALEGLKHEIEMLHDQLEKAAGGEKSIIAGQIKELKLEIPKAQAELNKCMAKHPYVQPPPPKPNPCLSYKYKLDVAEGALENEIQKAIAPLKKQLQNAPKNQKAEIRGEIAELRQSILETSIWPKRISDAGKAYADCLTKNGGLLALDSTFKGTSTLETDNENAPGPYKQSVTIGLHFSDWDHREITVTSFPPISVTYDVSVIGSVTTTVSLHGSASGSYDPTTELISLSLSLFFHHSTDLAGDSTLDLTLVSNKPITKKGEVTVSGESKFKGGYLDGYNCWLTVTGRISPRP